MTVGNLSGVQIGVTDLASGNVVTAAGMGAVEERDQVAVDVTKSISIMENIETERVPCPRLCGATFCSGSGGLAVFHNGGVKKMWDWYKRADTFRSAPGITSDTTFSNTEDIGLDTESSALKEDNMLSRPLDSTPSQAIVPLRSGPKTLRDLVNMTSTAKKVSGNKRPCIYYTLKSDNE